MSDDFDALPRGDGNNPSKAEVVTVYQYMVARGRAKRSPEVVSELEALGFKTSKATVCRMLDGIAKWQTKKENNALDTSEKRTQRKRLNNKHEHKVAPPSEQVAKSIGDVADKLIEKLADDTLAADIKELLSKDGDMPKHSSTSLAIEENRIRMAVNIALGRRMIEKSEFLLVDMRGTAALVDALTCAVKVSGGASIDISRPAAGETEPPPGISPGGQPMKDVTPVRSLAADLAQFRREKSAGNGART